MLLDVKYVFIQPLSSISAARSLGANSNDVRQKILINPSHTHHCINHMAAYDV